MSATGAFATIILERLLDVVNRPDASGVSCSCLAATSGARIRPSLSASVAGGTAARSLGALAVLFVLAGDPERSATMTRLEQLLLRRSRPHRPHRGEVRARSRAIRRPAASSLGHFVVADDRLRIGPSRWRSPRRPFTGSFS